MPRYIISNADNKKEPVLKLALEEQGGIVSVIGIDSLGEKWYICEF